MGDPADSRSSTSNASCSLVPEKKIPGMLRLPQELLLGIWKYLHPVERICLLLTCHHYHDLLLPITPRYALSTGSPSSRHPLIKETGCKHCLPVLYSPAHCELHFHLRSFFPRSLTYCYVCGKFTSCERKGYSDSHEHCGVCAVKYTRMFERGRRRVGKIEKGTGEPEAGPKKWRGPRWFNRSFGRHEIW